MYNDLELYHYILLIDRPSVRQQNLPVTIKYPEMVAQIAPYFEGDDIPDYGKNNLWFL